MSARTIANFRNDSNDRPVPPKLAQNEPVLEERLVKIIDADVQEDEGTTEHPYVTKHLWLLLQDTLTQAIFRSVLSMEDIQKITGMSRQLQGREIYKFADLLKNREAPIKLVVDVANAEVDPSMILAHSQVRTQQEIDEDIEQEISEIGLSQPRRVAQVSKFQFEPNKAKKIQNRVNHE